MLAVRKVEAKEGVRWISEGWKIYKKRPFYWAALTLVAFALQMLLGWIPVLGWAVYFLVSPMYTGIMTLGAAQLRQAESFETTSVLLASVRKLPTIIAYALLLLVLVGVVVVAPLMLLSLEMPWGQLLTADHDQIQALVVTFFSSLSITHMVAILLWVSISVLVMSMASFFGQALIFLKSVSAKDAMVLSIKCSLTNVWPLTVWLGILLLLSILAAIPLGLGFLITVPLFHISNYVLIDAVFAEAVVPL